MDEIEQLFAQLRNAPYRALGADPNAIAYETQDPGAASGFLDDNYDIPTPNDIGSPYAYDTPEILAGGKRIYVGTSDPTGMSEGDIWFRG